MVQNLTRAMWSWTCLLVMCVAVAASDDSKDEWREVKIAQGPVRGHRDSSGDFWTFINVPYATAPKGRNKFKAPLPPPTWTEPYDAIDKSIICPQFLIELYMPGEYAMQEDCLVASVYVPDTDKKNLTVLIVIHGGSFHTEYGEWAQWKNLIKKDMIYITFNYRLGITGFLCMGTEDIPGNAGMKDQVALIRWVHENIAAFGGNPNDVTLTGYSAGAAAVDLLMLSKTTDGLYNKGLIESASGLAVYSIQSDPLQNAKDHAKKLNFSNVDDIYALEEFYKTLSSEDLIAEAFTDRTDFTFLFSPCLERNTGDEPFLTESPKNILKSGNYRKFPVLYSITDMEGLIVAGEFDTAKVKMNEKFSDFLPPDLKFETEDEREEVAKQIKEFYFGVNPISEENILGYIYLLTDVMFSYPILTAVKLHVESGNDQVYLYAYSYVHEDVPFVPYTNVRGANHCDQTLAIADCKDNFIRYEPTDISEGYKNMKKTLREIWRNFIKTGQPVPEGSSLPTWPPVGANSSPHMSIGDKMELRGVLLEERYRFWDNIYQKYNKDPIPPPPPPPKSRTEL